VYTGTRGSAGGGGSSTGGGGAIGAGTGSGGVGGAGGGGAGIDRKWLTVLIEASFDWKADLHRSIDEQVRL